MLNNKGFTLIEIIVAVALVAILSAAIAPSVINNIAQGRISRALNDVQELASAVARFRKDTGAYPNRIKPGGSNTLFAFLSTRGPDGHPAITTLDPKYWAKNGGGTPAANWPSAFTLAGGANSCQDITSHMMLGRDREDSTYRTATNPDDPLEVGFRGAMMNADPLDPWGHRYMINVGALGTVGEVVWVISAGTDGIWQTNVLNTGLSASDSLKGDDIGVRIQ